MGHDATGGCRTVCFIGSDRYEELWLCGDCSDDFSEKYKDYYDENEGVYKDVPKPKKIRLVLTTFYPFFD